MEKRLENYIHSLSRLIDVPTVSDAETPNGDVFDRFHCLLRETFPRVFGTFCYEEFHGSILLSHTVEGGPDPILFMSHHDVVSANGEWTHEPFCATVDGGKLYGRGTLDTKGNLWAILTALEELLSEGYEFKRSVFVESACNEETTGAGAHEISRELKKRGVRFAFTMDEGGMIVYDPFGGIDGSYAMVAIGEKDCVDLKFIARSHGGHASTPDKHNPLSRLSRFVVDVEKRKLFKPKLDDVTLETFARFSLKVKGKMKFVFRRARCFRRLLAWALTKYSPSANAMVRTTICFTKARGSSEYNVIPTEAYVTGNMRVAHHDSKEDLLKKLRKIASEYDVLVEEIDPGFHSDVCDYKTAEFALLEETVGECFPDVVTAPFISTGASDSKFFGDLSANVFRFAPFAVSDEQLDAMHAKDENIDVSTLIPAVDFYKKLIKKAEK